MQRGTERNLLFARLSDFIAGAATTVSEERLLYDKSRVVRSTEHCSIFGILVSLLLERSSSESLGSLSKQLGIELRLLCDRSTLITYIKYHVKKLQ